MNLPPRLIQNVAAHLMEFTKLEDSPYHNGYPNGIDEDGEPTMPAPCVEDRFLDAVKNQLELEMPRYAFNQYVRDMVAVEFADNKMIIACRDDSSCEWAESRLTTIMQRLLVGPMNAEVKVRFIVEPA